MEIEHLEFLLKAGLKSKKWDPTERRLTLTFHPHHGKGTRKLFWALYCFIDTRNERGEVKKGKNIYWVKTLIESDPNDLSPTLILRLTVTHDEPYAVLFCLPEFWGDAASGQVKEKYHLHCVRINLT